MWMNIQTSALTAKLRLTSLMNREPSSPSVKAAMVKHSRRAVVWNTMPLEVSKVYVAYVAATSA